jgi:hypothetical protein
MRALQSMGAEIAVLWGKRRVSQEEQCRTVDTNLCLCLREYENLVGAVAKKPPPFHCDPAWPRCANCPIPSRARALGSRPSSCTFAAPHSFTGEDRLGWQCHGSRAAYLQCRTLGQITATISATSTSTAGPRIHLAVKWENSPNAPLNRASSKRWKHAYCPICSRPTRHCDVPWKFTVCNSENLSPVDTARQRAELIAGLAHADAKIDGERSCIVG